MTAVPSTPSSKVWQGVALGIAGSIAFSGKAILAKLMYRHGVDAMQVMFWRMLLSLPLFLALAWWAGRGKPAFTRSDWGAVAGLGFVGYYLSSFLDFTGLQYVSASLGRLIQYLNPTIVLAMSALWLGARVSGRQLGAIALAYFGVWMVFREELRFEGSNIVLGSLLVFASAVTYAVYLITSGQVVKRLGALRLTGAATSVACVLAIGQLLVLRGASAAAVPEAVVWLSLLNAVVSTFLPVLMVMMAIERIGAPLTSQCGLVGPVSTIGLGVVLLGEPFTGWIAGGTLLVLTGVWLLAKWRT